MVFARLPVFVLLATLTVALSACGSGAGKSAAKTPREGIAAKAATGDAEAQYLLGIEICCGSGDESGRKDLVLATQWLCRAARQNDARAQYRLGLIHGGDLVEVGLGARLMSRIGVGADTPARPAVAAMWLDLAMAGGHEEAATRRIALGKRMSASDHVAAEKLRAKWREAPCELNPVQSPSAGAAERR